MTVSQRDRRIIDDCTDTDEPTIVFRAQDRFSVAVLGAYLSFVAHAEAEANGVDADFRDAVEKRFEEFQNWQRLNPVKVKTPDLRPEESTS
jgi:hypothetical protein